VKSNLGVASGKQTRKPTRWAWELKRERKNPKLEAETRKRRAIWGWREKSKQKNPRGGFGNRETSEKTQNRKLKPEREE